MYRRTVLASAGTLAIGSSSIAPARVGTGGDGCETEEVVVGRSSDGEITEEVPAEWREHVEFVEDEHERLREEYGDEEWYEGSGITGGDGTVCDRGTMAIRVRVSDRNAAEEALEGEYEGVEVLLEDDADEDRLAVEESDGTDDTEDTEVAQEDEVDEIDEMPGFGPLAGLAGLGGGAYVHLRRRGR